VGTGLKVIHVAKNLSAFHPCREPLLETKLKGGRLYSDGGHFKAASHSGCDLDSSLLLAKFIVRTENKKQSKKI
jgi:hypothetical protein